MSRKVRSLRLRSSMLSIRVTKLCFIRVQAVVTPLRGDLTIFAACFPMYAGAAIMNVMQSTKIHFSSEPHCGGGHGGLPTHLDRRQPVSLRHIDEVRTFVPKLQRGLAVVDLRLHYVRALGDRPRFTISLKRRTRNLQLSTTSPADYPIFGATASFRSAEKQRALWATGRHEDGHKP
jgi:hypothetical protein